MANFSEHIAQAKSNLSFLESVIGINNFWDWKVTVSFYIGVHLINAHIASMADLHYRTHNKVDEAINPFKELSLTKLTEQDYLAYTKLLGLSRRSRYLVHDKPSNKSENSHFTYEKHFIKAIKNLDKILAFMQKEHNVTFNCINFKSEYYNTKTLTFFAPV